jgi:type I restriction-modification system DNA methylase subunit
MDVMMSEELLQRDLVVNPQKIGKWDFYNIGATTVKALKDYNIIRNVDYGEYEKKKIDALIVHRKRVLAVIEYKKPSEFKTPQQKAKAIGQELAVARKLDSKILIATDTQETVWVNTYTGKKILDENGNSLKLKFDPNSEAIVSLIDKINESVNEINNQIKPKRLVNPTDLAKQIWQDIWSVSGATPENCLYTFIELFIFKYLSDLDVLKGIYGFDTLIDSYKTNTAEEVLENYAGVVRPKIKVLFPENPLDKTTIINGTIFVSKDQKAVKDYSTVFKKVLLKFQEYGKLEHIDYDFKSQLFESFLKESISKKNWGQFFTPLKVVRSIVEMAKDDIREGISICDPACGVGKFLLEPLATKIDQFFNIDKNRIIPKIDLSGFDKGFDRDEQKTIILAKANMLIYFSDFIKENPGLTAEFAKLFNQVFTLKTNSILGSLSEPVKCKYDLILTNPPYVTSGSSNLKEEISKDGTLTDHFKINALGVEGLFLEWIIRALKPNGKAYIVIPDGVLNRQHDKHLRKFIFDECYIDAIISLPINTFFTTNKKTYILCLTKKPLPSEKQVEPVFTYLVSEIGETRDVNRFEIDQNDLQEAVTLFTFFKHAKRKFQKINTDSRCKIIEFNNFKDSYEKNWVIDYYWSEDERIQLGILKENKVYSISEFSLFLGEISTNLLELQNELDGLEEKKKRQIHFETYELNSLFDPKLGNPKYTRKYGNKNKGPYPVYGASNHEPLTYISTYDYEGDHLTWARNGFAGYMKATTGKFSVNYDRGILIPKNNSISVKYVQHVLEPILRKLAVGRKDIAGGDEFTKLYLSTIKEQSIQVPIDSNNMISRDIQEGLVREYEFITDIKNELQKQIEEIEDLSIHIEYDIDGFIKKNITDLFRIEKGNSKYTKTYVKKHPGTYPLYSSQTTEDGILGYIDTYDYDIDCLTWTTDGIHAGTVFLRNVKFSMTTHCGAVIPLDEFAKNLYLPYIYHHLNTTLKKEALGEQNKRVTVDIIKTIKIPIPFSDGQIDMEKQLEIADKYIKIKSIRNEVTSQLRRLAQSLPSFR